ncbi:transposase family protein [Streptomyces sp. NPDC054771]
MHEDRLRLLLEGAAQVTAPRDRRGRVHPPPFVLAPAVLAATAGARTSLETAEHSADLDQRVLRVLGRRQWSGTPSRRTFDRILARIGDAELDRVLSWWSSPGRQAAAVAVDGETMRAAATGQSSIPLTLVVAATGADGSVLGQAQQVAGGSENAAALDLIARLGPERLSGAVLTADAKHTSARFDAAAGARRMKAALRAAGRRPEQVLEVLPVPR